MDYLWWWKDRECLKIEIKISGKTEEYHIWKGFFSPRRFLKLEVPILVSKELKRRFKEKANLQRCMVLLSLPQLRSRPITTPVKLVASDSTPGATVCTSVQIPHVCITWLHRSYLFPIPNSRLNYVFKENCEEINMFSYPSWVWKPWSFALKCIDSLHFIYFNGDHNTWAMVPIKTTNKVAVA